tara:strand:+ start:8164 stop:9075 length:912 start_codon:yes stop_codon:yes gene_type:complete
MATVDIPGSSPTISIDLRKDKTKERDPKSLCGSKHAVWIGIEPPPVGGPNKIIPYENNIVVAFWANDTSGGGILDPGAVIGGIGTMITDPKEYEQTVAEGLDIVWGRDNETFGDYAEAVGYTTVYVITAPVRAVAAVGNWAYSGITSLFAETDESFNTDTDFLGLDYHNAAAAAHKVSIEISCRYQGQTRIVHQTELAGTSAVYGGNKPKPALAYFVIDSPGEWKVRVKSLASATCADPRLDVVETFTVAEPKSTAEAEDSDSPESPAALDRLFTDPKTLGVQVAGGLAGLTAWWLLFRRGKA